jgi:biotin carboxyl carrier protein
MIGGVAVAIAVASFRIARWTAPVAPAPVAEKAAQKSGPVELTVPDAYLQTASIVIDKAQSVGAGADILATARVAASPQGEAVVVARASGAISRMTKRLGDSVRAGEVLALVDSLDAAGFSADRSVAGAKAEQARRAYDRELSLFKQGVTPARTWRPHKPRWPWPRPRHAAPPPWPAPPMSAAAAVQWPSSARSQAASPHRPRRLAPMSNRRQNCSAWPAAMRSR